MLNGLRHKDFFKTPYAVGIHIHQPAEGPALFCAVVVKNESGKLKIEEQFNNIEDLNKAVEKYTDSHTYLLSYTGRGVLEKKIFKQENEDHINLNAALPGASDKTFDYSVADTVIDEEKYVYLTRKEVIETMLGTFSTSEFKLFDVTIGEANANLLSLLLADQHSENQKINVNGKELIFNQGKLYKVNEATENTFHLNFGGVAINESNAIALSTALKYFSLPLDTIVSSNETVAQNCEDEKDKRLYKKSVFLFIISLTVLFFINFFVNYILQKNTNELTAEFSKNQAVINRLRRLTKEVNEKESFLKDNGLLTESRISYYADRIAATAPDDIRFDIFELNTRIKDAKQDDLFKFKSNNCKLEGECKKSVTLFNWVNELKKAKWTKEVKLINYTQDKSDYVAHFIMEIELK